MATAILIDISSCGYVCVSGKSRLVAVMATFLEGLETSDPGMPTYEEAEIKHHGQSTWI